jgi:quercetin dioxygenase-like cupin family protein
MNKWSSFCVAFTILLLSSLVTAQEKGTIKPQLILSEMVQGMPKGEKQEVRVLSASFQPGERTLFHMHRYPVTVYVLEGTFTMEIEGRDPIIVKAGRAGIMPPNMKMTGYNRSNTDPLRLVAVYVSDPNTPFLDPVHTP